MCYILIKVLIMKKVVLSLLLVVPLVGCTTKALPTSFSFQLNDLGQNVDFHTELQARYIAAEDYSTTAGIASGSSSKEYPDPVKITWHGKANNGKKADHFKIRVFEENNDVPVINGTTSYDSEYELFNLKINTSYEYDVTAVYSDSVSFTSEKSSFKTTDKGPRNLLVENVMNIRDLGGHGIKQGLIYRSGRFNESDGTTNINDVTIMRMNVELGIKTEIDLRRDNEFGGITVSPLGQNVNYVHLPMYYGGENVLTYVGESSGVSYNNPVQIKAFFETLANENNYPIDFHCAIGKDRTGCMAYLVEALCGMEEEYLYRDYLFSNFAKISGMCEASDIDDRYGATVKAYTGATLQEKVFNYLNQEIGVSVDNLRAIQNILTDK